ncbi:PAS domain S-box protein [Ensifer adhaerens]|uniref:PAS domain S-box protein n=1 Tax=Ensifer adhaerens TaxID=106592 RepID=UPI00156998F0|nr:PAS domain S-box protein [Ensifer adhaerens]
MAKSDAHELDRARLAAIVDSSFDPIISKDLDGTVRTWNRAAEQVFGYSAKEMIGAPIFKIVPPHLENEEREILARVGVGDHIPAFETVRQLKDLSYITVSLTLSPIKNAQGHIVGASAITRDITASRDRERRIRVLLREVNHRVKNQYAIILSMIRQMRWTETDPQTFERHIAERIMALSASHDLIVSADWEGAALADLVAIQLKPFGHDDVIAFRGPAVMLTPKAVENLGMAFHELALNSSRHGVLSGKPGTITISWNVGQAADPKTFFVQWDEKTSDPFPAAGEPSSGFGSVILRRVAPQALGSAGEIIREKFRLNWTLQGQLSGFTTDIEQ